LLLSLSIDSCESVLQRCVLGVNLVVDWGNTVDVRHELIMVSSVEGGVDAILPIKPGVDFFWVEVEGEDDWSSGGWSELNKPETVVIVLCSCPVGFISVLDGPLLHSSAVYAF